MTKQISFTSFGIEFFVDVTYERDGNKVSIEEVNDVWIEGPDGENHLVKCVAEEFFKSFDGELHEALEEAIRDEEAAYAEMRYDAAKEEGLLDK